MSSAFPRPFVTLRDALRRGDEQAAKAAQSHVEQVAAALGTVALIKAALELRGLPAGPPRVAVDPPTPDRLDALRAAIDDVG